MLVGVSSVGKTTCICGTGGRCQLNSHYYYEKVMTKIYCVTDPCSITVVQVGAVARRRAISCTLPELRPPTVCLTHHHGHSHHQRTDSLNSFHPACLDVPSVCAADILEFVISLLLLWFLRFGNENFRLEYPSLPGRVEVFADPGARHESVDRRSAVLRWCRRQKISPTPFQTVPMEINSS